VIVLDTNVLSEVMKPSPTRAVVTWLDTKPRTILYTTSVTQAEILHGIRLLPTGRRRSQLQAAADAMFDEDLADRILGFGSAAAKLYVEIAIHRRRIGRPISHFDAQIAAIARAGGASVATRNVDDFEDCGVTVLDPWKPARA
jgi:toxin FitB